MERCGQLNRKELTVNTAATASPIEIPQRQNSDDSCIGSMSPSKSIGTQTPIDKLSFEYPPIATLDGDDDVFADSLLDLDLNDEKPRTLHAKHSFREAGEKWFSGWFKSSRGDYTPESRTNVGRSVRSRSLSSSYEEPKIIGRQLRDIADNLDRQLHRASSSRNSRGRRIVRNHSLRDHY